MNSEGITSVFPRKVNGNPVCTDRGFVSEDVMVDHVPFVSLVPPRLIHELVDLSSLPRADRLFYERDSKRSRAFMDADTVRRAYIDRQPCRVLKFRCMDEKENDTELSLGLPRGASNSIEVAGNQIGEGNLLVNLEVQKHVDRAVAIGKRVLVLFIAHESEKFPHEDSCAALNHSIDRADANACHHIDRLNHDYVERNETGKIVERYLIAVRLKSITDTESRIWCGAHHQRVDPMCYAQRLGQDPHSRSLLTGCALMAEVFRDFREAFPFDDPRFESLRRDEWEAVLTQMAEMCVNNILVVRARIAKHLPVRKSGHKGTRILEGRGWKMYDEVNKYFRISDLSPDEILRKQIRIGYKFLLRNELLKIVRKGLHRRPKCTIHVNVPYDQERKADRGGSIRQAMGKARELKRMLVDLMSGKHRRAFNAELRRALEQEGVHWGDLPKEVRAAYRENPLGGLCIYVSVSSRETCALELVATHKDL